MTSLLNMVLSMILQWGEAKEEVVAEDEPADDLGQAIRDAQRECEKWKGEDQVRAHARGSQEIAIPNLWCGAEKVGYHTGIAVMEDKEWCIWQGIWGVTENPKEDASEG